MNDWFFNMHKIIIKYKKEGNNQSIIEMKKYIGAMKLAGSEHIAKTYEAHLKKLIEENS